MFVPLAHPPGDAQADFGDALVVIAGVECKAHYLVVDLPHSDDGFVKAFPAETTEAFCDGHNAAFTYFGGVPRRIVYDNIKLAVARILGDGTRQRTQVFSELQSHYLFDARFWRPGKGNDKGKVEGLVVYARRNFFVPIPRVGSWDALNADLERQCNARRARGRSSILTSPPHGRLQPRHSTAGWSSFPPPRWSNFAPPLTTLRSAHLFQISSYLENQPDERFRNSCEGMLLYPTVNKTLIASYTDKGRVISIRTIKLNQSWQGIHDDLVALVA